MCVCVCKRHLHQWTLLVPVIHAVSTSYKSGGKGIALIITLICHCRHHLNHFLHRCQQQQQQKCVHMHLIVRTRRLIPTKLFSFNLTVRTRRLIPTKLFSFNRTVRTRRLIPTKLFSLTKRSEHVGFYQQSYCL